MTSTRTSLPAIKGDSLHDHHIYPVAYLRKQGCERREYNQVTNRMLITSRTNQKIKAQPPHVYLKGTNGKVLKKHFLFCDIWTDKLSFQEFIERRRELMVDRIWSIVRSGE